MRRVGKKCLFAILAVVLASAAPARADVTPLALLREAGAGTALAGDAVLFTRGVDVMRVSASGGAPVKVFDFTPFKGFRPDVPVLVATPLRAVVVEHTFEGELVQGFAGPPEGPFTALGRPARLEDYAKRIESVQVDGDQVYVHGLDGVRDGAGRPVATDLNAEDAAGLRFAGTLQAYTTHVPGEDTYTYRRLVIREPATGAQRVLDFPYYIGSVDLRPDGRAVVTIGDDVYDVPANAPPAIVTKGSGARFAGDSIVFARGQRGLFVRDPGGKVRPIGVRTHTPGGFTTDADRVVFSANHCVYIANLQDPRANRIPPGPCARMELEQRSLDSLPIRRRVRLRLACVAGPCSGTVDLRSEFRPGSLNRPAHFRIPTGRVGHVDVRLTDYGLKTLRGDAKRDELGFPGADVFTVDDAGVRVQVPGDGLIFYQPSAG